MSTRQDLERRAAAALELKRRRAERNSNASTVYGIYRPGKNGPELLRCVHRVGDTWGETDREPVVTVPEKLEPVLYAKQRFVILYGGRGGAKSQTVGDILLSYAKDRGDKALCLREFQASIEDSVHSLLKEEIDRLGFASLSVTKTSISKGRQDTFRFKGLARDPESVKSAHGFKRSWVEEAQTLSHESLQKLTPTIRTAGSQLIFTLNPGSVEDPMSKRFLSPFQDSLDRDGYYEDDLHLIIRINYSDNPWHSRELEAERQFDQEHKTVAEYRHIWEGDYMDEVAGSIIPVEWFEAAIDAHEKLGFKPVGAKVVAHDPSDKGEDAKGLVTMHGVVVTDAVELLGPNRQPVDINEGMDLALERCSGADHFVWDVDGLGAGLRRQVTRALDATMTEFHEFRGGGAVDAPDSPIDPDAPGGRTNGDAYPNRRSQAYYQLADRFRLTWLAVTKGRYMDPDKLISISRSVQQLDKLRAEVCRVPRKPNSAGKLQVMSKAEMLRVHKIKSPNLADSLMMAASALTSTSTSGWGQDPEYDLRWVV